MAVDQQLDRLSRQLSKQRLGPVETFLDQVLSELGAAIVFLSGWLKQAAHDQPLMTLLLSCQAGYLAARLGRLAGRR
ncbi:MAG TPA: hypothetical protein VGM32_12255 [Rhodopila sp.]|jgi:hypothetical protein